MEADSFTNLPSQENHLSDCSDLMGFGIGSFENHIDVSNQEAIQKSIRENSGEAAVETPFVDVSDGNMVEQMVNEGSSSGSLIGQDMEKVSLVGGSVSLGSGVDGVSAISESNDCLPELKPKEKGDDVNNVFLFVDSKSELKLKANGNVTNECALDGESKNGLKLTDNVTVGSEMQTREKVGENKESDGSDSSDLMSESDSSDSESESDGDSDSSSTSSLSSEEGAEDKEEEVVEVGEIEVGEAMDLEEGIFVGSEDDEEGVVKGQIKSKNEIEVLPPVLPVNVTLEPHHQTLPVGVILSIIEAKVVVEGLEKHNPLSEGSILWITETRSPLGLVDEIFGPVKNPYYIVRYNSDQELPAGIHGGTPVSFVAEFADYVLSDNNLYKKGYDASGENDEELPEVVEFSDDEKEAEYKRAQRVTNNGGNDKKRGNRNSGNRKKVQHKGTSWKNCNLPLQPLVEPVRNPSNSPNTGQPSNSPYMGLSSNNPNMGQPSNNSNMGHPSYNPYQFHMPHVQAPFGCGSFPSTSGTRPDCVNGSASAPSASQVAQANSSTPQNLVSPNEVWMNGMEFQQQQHMFFPNGFQTNGMPPQQLNQHQHPPQMFNGFPNGLQIQQQFSPYQMLLPNQSLPYGHQIFTPRPSTCWPGPMGQAAVNQVQFGMGFQGNPMHASQSGGESGAFSNASLNEQRNEMPSPSNSQGNQGNFGAQRQNVRGGTPRGRRPYRHGGGNFSGRRGHQ